MALRHPERRFASLVVAAMLVITLPACGSTEGGGGDDQSKSAPQGQSAGGTTDAGGAVDEVRDGTWEVDDAGEVEFSLEDGSLSLTDVRPNSGWDQRVADEESDEIEVHFTQGNTDWKFEVELDPDNMEISKEQDVQPAEGGTYQVGDAAEVEFQSDGDSLTLVDVRPNDGWEIGKRDESTDDIEIDFSQGDATAEFEAEISNGAVKVETDQKVTGPIPS